SLLLLCGDNRWSNLEAEGDAIGSGTACKPRGRVRRRYDIGPIIGVKNIPAKNHSPPPAVSGFVAQTKINRRIGLCRKRAVDAWKQSVGRARRYRDAASANRRVG